MELKGQVTISIDDFEKLKNTTDSELDAIEICFREKED